MTPSVAASVVTGQAIQQSTVLAPGPVPHRRDPSTTDAISPMRTGLEKELESVMSLRKEVASAKLLAALPSLEQIRFYNENIKPIQVDESRIANEEIEIMRRAKARGVKLPDQMYRDAGIE